MRLACISGPPLVFWPLLVTALAEARRLAEAPGATVSSPRPRAESALLAKAKASTPSAPWAELWASHPSHTARGPEQASQIRMIMLQRSALSL